MTSVFEYSGLFPKILKKLKYRFVFDVSQDLVELFLTSLGEDVVFTQILLAQHPRGDSLKKKPILVPVPLHPARERWRGFNQSVLLGKEIAENLGIRFFPLLLKRTKNTQPQSLLDEKQRKKNIKGAFVVNPNFPKYLSLNTKFLLFDDVWTTGATLRECARILKRNRASFVWGLTLAS